MILVPHELQVQRRTGGCGDVYMSLPSDDAESSRDERLSCAFVRAATHLGLLASWSSILRLLLKNVESGPSSKYSQRR